MAIFTYQDFMKVRTNSVEGAVRTAIDRHRMSEQYRVAVDADAYDRQQNTTIISFVRWLYNSDGSIAMDTMSSSNRLASNFFRRLNTQRATYLLGNGVTFEDDGIKEQFDQDFDRVIMDAGYHALIHGVSYIFLNVDHCHVFRLTEFAPLLDEENGTIRAGVRFWRLDANHPMMAVLYEEDGYTKLRADDDTGAFKIVEDKRAYRVHTLQAPIDDEPEIVGEDNWTALPIVPVYGSRLKQSTLVGMKALIDAYDLVKSGYCNDLSDCSEIYWIVSNAGGMDDTDLANFRDRLRHQHIANVADADDVSVTPYTQEVPYASRKTFLDDIRASIYEDFGGLDVHTIAAGATNDHIEAAYQAVDEQADDFEYQIIDAVQLLLKLIGREGTPLFKRNRISNEVEKTNMILAAATYLDEETVLNKLPFITPDEVHDIMDRKDAENMERFGSEYVSDPSQIKEPDEGGALNG